MCRGSEGKGSEYDIPACAGLFSIFSGLFLAPPEYGQFDFRELF